MPKQKITKNRCFQNDGVMVSQSRVAGLGVFARRKFRKNEIIEVAPVISVTKNCELLYHTELNHYQFESLDEKSLIIGLGYSSMYNHMHNPNATFLVLDDIIIIQSRRIIQSGEEIFVNYGWDAETLEEAGII